MKKRDLKADLELCNKATPGPWTASTNAKPPTSVFYDVVRGNAGIAITNKENVEFIAQSREGWPYAIEQALAEKERAEIAELALEKACIRLAAEFGAHPEGGRKDYWKEYFLTVAKEALGDDKVHTGR